MGFWGVLMGFCFFLKIFKKSEKLYFRSNEVVKVLPKSHVNEI